MYRPTLIVNLFSFYVLAAVAYSYPHLAAVESDVESLHVGPASGIPNVPVRRMEGPLNTTTHNPGLENANQYAQNVGIVMVPDPEEAIDSDETVALYGLPGEPYYGLTYKPTAALADVTNHVAIFLHGINPRYEPYIAAGTLNTDEEPRLDGTLASLFNLARLQRGVILDITFLVPDFEPNYDLEPGRYWVPHYTIALRAFLAQVEMNAIIRHGSYSENLDLRDQWYFYMHQNLFNTVGAMELRGASYIEAALSESGSNGNQSSSSSIGPDSDDDMSVIDGAVPEHLVANETMSPGM